MIIAELSRFQELDSSGTNITHFVYRYYPSAHVTADYWINIFGAPDESSTLIIYIGSIVRGNFFYYRTNNLNDCIDIEASFFWDETNQALYIHFEHDQSKFTDQYYYSNIYGLTDKDSIYIDSIYYNSLIESIPSIAQQQDLINYDKLAFMSGSVILRNVSGVLDFLIDENVVGNDLILYYLDDSIPKTDYERTELISIAYFFIENMTYSLSSINFSVQDFRKKFNVKLPVDRFNSTDYPNIKEKYLDDVVPVMYGKVRVSEAIPIDGDTLAGTVTFRQAILLTSLGTVQVEIDDLWTTKVPVSTDLNTGSFTLAQADGRQANGEPYKCRVVDSVGIANTYASDIIKDLNERFAGIKYVDSTFNRTEWEQEETSLESIGILFNKETELYDAIKEVQIGSNVGFRYEITSSGLRTIRIDDIDRDYDLYIPKEKHEYFDMSIDTNSELLSAIVKVNYSKDYQLNKYLNVIDESESENVLDDYKVQPTIEINTHLITQSQAEARALLYADRFSIMPRVASVRLLGSDFYFLRIYDILEIELTPGFVDIDSGQIVYREFFGVWKCQILSVSPDFTNQTNTITIYLIEKLRTVDYARITEDESPRILEQQENTTTIKREVD